MTGGVPRAAVLAALAAVGVAAAAEPSRHGFTLTGENVGIGYDPVSYFPKAAASRPRSRADGRSAFNDRRVDVDPEGFARRQLVGAREVSPWSADAEGSIYSAARATMTSSSTRSHVARTMEYEQAFDLSRRDLEVSA